MSIEENKALVRRYFEAIDRRKDLAVIDEFLAPNFVSHTETTFGADIEGQKKIFEMTLRAFPNGHHVIEDMIAEGDKVVTRITGYGTHTGELLKIAPTGTDITYTGVAIHRIEGDKIVEHWQQQDTLGLLQQLGLVPELGG